MWTHYTPTQGTSIILNALFVLTFLPQLKNWRNTSKKNMVDSNLVSKKYKPRDTVKRGWSEKNARKKAEAEARRTAYFPCKECVEGFNTKRELDKHITDKHIFICGECLKTFKTKAERDAHMKTDHKEVTTQMTKQEKLLAEEYHKRESREEKDR